MSDAPDRSPSSSLRTAHRTLLAAIVLCGAAAWMQPSPAEEPAPDPTITTVAIVVALVVILMRGAARSPSLAADTRAALTWAGYACGFALALLGVFLAVQMQQPRTGLAFALAALIFCLQPPSRTAPGA